MSRHKPWRNSRTGGAPALADALAESTARNRELRKDLDAAEKKADGAEFQLAFHRDELVKAKAKTAAETMRADGLEERLAALTLQLERERVHTAGSCSHAAEVRRQAHTIHEQARVIEELQRANESHEAPGWLPPGDVSVALSPGRQPPRIALPGKRGRD